MADSFCKSLQVLLFLGLILRISRLAKYTSGRVYWLAMALMPFLKNLGRVTITRTTHHAIVIDHGTVKRPYSRESCRRQSSLIILTPFISHLVGLRQDSALFSA